MRGDTLGTIYLCDLPANVVDKEFGARVEDYEKYTYVTVRTELGEMTLIKGYKKRFIVLLTGLHFEELGARVSIIVVGDGVFKLGLDAILSELSELTNNEMYLGSSFSIQEPVGVKLSSGEARAYVRRVIELFLNSSFDEEYCEVYHTIKRYNNVEDEYAEVSETWGVIIERAGLINFFPTEVGDDRRVYF